MTQLKHSELPIGTFLQCPNGKTAEIISWHIRKNEEFYMIIHDDRHLEEIPANSDKLSEAGFLVSVYE